MGQVLHGCARTTSATRREIQNSKESIKSLARRLGVNPKTVVKWRSRKGEGVEDRKTGPREKFNTKLTKLDEAMIISVRQKTQLPLDDCLDILMEHIPYLTRSALHRCLVRHGLARLPRESEQAAPKKKFKEYPIGYVHVDITEVRLSKDDKYYLFVGICRVSKYAYVQLYNTQTVDNAVDFLNNLIKAMPFKIHTVLTDNGSQFTFTQQALAKKPATRHKFDLACAANGIKHKTTQPYRPQTNGQVERFNRTLKEATLHVYHYVNREQMEKHINDFILAYNCGKRLSAIKRNTPIQECIRWWKENPRLFNINPNHQIVGLNT